MPLSFCLWFLFLISVPSGRDGIELAATAQTTRLRIPGEQGILLDYEGVTARSRQTCLVISADCNQMNEGRGLVKIL